MRIFGVLFAIVGFAGVAGAQYTNKSSVLDGSGTRSAGGSYTNISAAGQPGGIAVSAGGTYVNQAGFLNTFVLKPALDTDGDGLADEMDNDNDNDALADQTELAGSSFAPATVTSPNLADTDGDGIPDAAESVAGTDPTSATAGFRILAITNAAGLRYVAWTARGNNERTYVVRSAPQVSGPFTTVVFSNTVAGGTFPWYAVTNAIGDATAATNLFFAVEVKP